MTAILVPHIITVGTNRYGVNLPDEYGTVGEYLGIAKVTDPDAVAANPPAPETITALVRTGNIIKLRVGVGTRGHLKYRSLPCAVNKVQSAITQLVGKEMPGTARTADGTIIAGGIIHTVGTKQRRRLG